MATAAYFSNTFSVFFGAPGGPSTAALTVQVPDANSQVQHAASAGDVNGDGFGDLVVSATHYNPELAETYLYLGGPHGLSSPIAFAGSTPAM